MRVVPYDRSEQVSATTTRERGRAERYADASRRMRRGRRLVFAGFVVAVAGIIAYCLACFAAGADPDMGARFLEDPSYLVGPTLGVIGLGTLLWLVGSIVYLRAAMDSDPDRPDIIL
jgi:hypothetical protein